MVRAVTPFLLAIVSLYCTCAYSQWGEITADLHFKGFSTDTKYTAFETVESVPWPGRDVTRTSIYVVDVDRNAFATKHFQFDTDSADQPDFKPAYQAYELNIKNHFGITGSNPGNAIAFNEKDSTHTFFAGIEKYNIRLTLLKVPNSENDSEVMVKVDLIHNGKVTVLQAAERAPDSWGVTVDYKLMKAFLYKDKIAVFLQYRSSMIELPDIIRPMIVTGILK